jgi:hypothetical protein
VWSTSFRATDLADIISNAPDENTPTAGDDQEACA